MTRAYICVKMKVSDEKGWEGIMSLTFYMYPNCDSCRKAKKWLEEKKLDFIAKHIVEDTPSKEEILNFFELSDDQPRRFFNTSGKVYREENMKDKIKGATEKEMASYLASNGMLIRRPIITDGKKITVGFNKEVYEQVWLT